MIDMRQEFKRLLIIAVILVAVVLAYSGSFRGVFVYDDYINIVNSGQMENLHSAVSGTSRPLTNLSFHLHYRFGMVRAADFHLINLMIHLVNTVLIWMFVWAVSGGVSERQRFFAASLTAMIWGLHPVQTESVTYIVQRAEPLSVMFLLAGLLAGVCYIERRRKLSALFVPIFWALAFLSKPTAVSAPVILLLVDALLLSGGGGRALRLNWKLHAVSFAALLIPAILLSGTHESVTSAGFSMTVISPLDYWLFQPRSMVLYLYKFVWPQTLLIDYGYDIEKSVLVPLGFGLVLAVLTFAAMRAGGMIRFGLLFFYAGMLPVMAVPIADLFVEHRLYMPSTGLALILAGGVWRIKQRVAYSAYLKSSCAGILVLALAALGTRTWVRNSDYADAGVLWQQVVEHCPLNVRGYLGVGAEKARLGDLEGAEMMFRDAVRVYKGLDSIFLKDSFRTDYIYACRNAAVLLERRGLMEEAEWFRQEAGRQLSGI